MSRLIIIGAARPIEAEFMEIPAAGSGSTSYTIPVSFGDEASGRKIICAVHYSALSGSAITLSSPAIGGVAATEFPPGGALVGVLSSHYGVKWIGAEVPSGTSGNVEVTFSRSVAVRVAVWRMVNALDLTQTDHDTEMFSSTSDSPKSIDTDVISGGVQFAAATIYQEGGSFDFSAGISTDDYNESIAGSSEIRVIGGFELISADESSRVVSVSKSGGANWSGVLAGLSFR